MCACVCVVINLFVHHQFQVQKVVDQPELDLTRSLFFCIIQSKDMLTIKNQTWKIVMETFFSLKDQCAINHQKKKMSHWISLALVCKIFSQNICKYNHIKKNCQLPIIYKSLELFQLLWWLCWVSIARVATFLYQESLVWPAANAAVSETPYVCLFDPSLCCSAASKWVSSILFSEVIAKLPVWA